MARLFYGWVVVAGAFVVLFVAYGAQYSFGVFFAALLDDLQSAAFLGFCSAQGLGALYATALVFGYSYGTISTLFPAIVSDFFGRARAGTLVGVLFAVAGSMAGWGPWIAGAIHDATGSYTGAFLLAAGLNVLAIAVLRLCRPPRLAYPTLAPPRESATLSPR